MEDIFSPIDKVLQALDEYKERSGKFRSRCPAHLGESNNSLSVEEADDGRVLIHCHAGCDLKDILDALGLEAVDLFNHNGRPSGRPRLSMAKKAKKVEKRVVSEEDLPDGTYYEFESLGGEVLYMQRHKREYWIRREDGKWETYPGVMDNVPWVLYRLPELVEGVRTNRVIYHLEGMKDVETAREKLGVIATTSGSTSSWKDEFKAFYSGAEVVIVPDHDEKGREYAEKVAAAVWPLTQSVKVVHLPNLGKAEDLTDWLEAGHTKEEFFSVVQATEAYAPKTEEWPEPTPVEVELPEVHPLDLAMVPEPLRDWVADTSRRMDNAPPDFAAAAAVVVAGSLLGRKVGAKPKRNDDCVCVPNLWGGLVGLPASMKTPTLNQVLRPIKALAAEARERHEEASREHELDMMVASAERSALKKELENTAKKVVSSSASRDALDEIRANLDALEEPEAPTPRRYTTNDTSIEKMAELLMENPDGLLLFRDELVGWLKSLDKSGHEAARAFYLEAWNGDGSHEVDRIGRGSLFVKSICVSVLGGIQPGPLSSYVEGAFDEGESADGLLQRLQVLVYPDRGEFDPTDLAPDLDARKRAYKVYKNSPSSTWRPSSGTPLVMKRKCLLSASTMKARECSTAGEPPLRAR